MNFFTTSELELTSKMVVREFWAHVTITSVVYWKISAINLDIKWTWFVCRYGKCKRKSTQSKVYNIWIIRSVLWVIPRYLIVKEVTRLKRITVFGTKSKYLGT